MMVYLHYGMITVLVDHNIEGQAVLLWAREASPKSTHSLSNKLICSG